MGHPIEVNQVVGVTHHEVRVSPGLASAWLGAPLRDERLDHHRACAAGDLHGLTRLEYSIEDLIQLGAQGGGGDLHD